ARSRSPAKRCSAAASARSAPSRICKSPLLPAGSLRPHQIDENILERALRGIEVLEPDAGAGKISEESGDARPWALRVVGVDQLAAAIGERQMVAVEFGRNGSDRVMELQCELLLAELVHQLALVLDEDQLALVDDADTIGHVLGLVDVMRGEDDGHA